MNRRIALVLILILTASSLIVVKTAPASASIPKPSVPEFTLKFVDYSYDVPPTYGIDPYTGKVVMTNTGGHVENTTIEVTIKNQLFTSYKDASGNYTSLYYNIKFKGHYEDEWQTYPMDPLDGYINAALSDYTVVSMPHWQIAAVPAGGQVDFQVQALIGHDNPVNGYAGGWETVFHYFTGEASEWSSIQTITIPASTPSPSSSPSPTSTPDQTTEPTTNGTSQTLQLEAIIGTIIAVVVVSAVLLVYFKKRNSSERTPTRRIALALPLILALLASLIAGMQAVEVAEANFFIGPYITTQSPVSWKVYTNTSIPLDVESSVRYDSPEIVRFLYCLDRSSNVTLTNLTKTGTVGGYEFHAASVLENLAEGNHTLKVYSQDASGKEMSASVEFMVDTDFKSPLLVLSPKNITYTASEVPLTYVCSEEITQSAYYQLDAIEGPPIEEGPISENLTLHELSIGDHRIRVDVWTVKGPFSQTIYFSVSEPEPFPTTLVIGSVIAVAVAGLGLFVYFKKRNRKT